MIVDTLLKQIKKHTQKKAQRLNSKISKEFSTLLSESFKITTAEKDHHDKKAYPFLISTSRGFMPRLNPLTKLPERFAALESILQRMVWHQPDGTPGLMQKNQLLDAVKNELPLLEVGDITDTMEQLAIYRDYSFLNNAFVLEPCHQKWEKTGNDYGLGRDFLPKNIAVPYTKISKMLELKPYLEYNTGYGLNNWKFIDEKQGFKYENMDVIRMFYGTDSERGFILTHCTINSFAGNLIRAGTNALKAAETDNRALFDTSLSEMKDSLMYMNVELNRMFIESNPKDYNTFRTFIMGITGQPMFPKGVVYEDCFDGKPQFYRGETGANDSIIPFCDNIIEITGRLPSNLLTDMLRDFRTYRTKTHQDYLKWVEETSVKIGMVNYAKKSSHSMVMMLEVADQIRTFRHTHWVLTNLYIMNYSTHPLATGGSPIVRYLPNQLLAVIDYIKDYSKHVDVKSLNSTDRFNFDAVVNRAESDEKVIHRQVEKRSKQYKNQ